MLTNGCATLYNRWEEEDAEQCIRTVLPAVFWQGEAQGGFTGRRYSKKGKEARYNALILVPGDRLPADRSYLPPRQWLALPKEEKKAVFYLSNRRCVGEGRLPLYLERAKSITGTGSDIRSFGQSADHPEGGEARRIFSLGVGGSLKGGGKSLNDSILERLKTLIAACPHLEKAKVYTDFVREDEICCGYFSGGGKRLSADWGRQRTLAV